MSKADSSSRRLSQNCSVRAQQSVVQLFSVRNYSMMMKIGLLVCCWIFLVGVSNVTADSYYQRMKEGRVVDVVDSNKYYKRYKTMKKKSSTKGTGGKGMKSPPKKYEKKSKGEKKPTWEPGNFSWGKYVRDHNGEKIFLSNGLYGQAIGLVDENVTFVDGTESTFPMHGQADGGAVFAKADGSGYYYASNSELGSWDEETGEVEATGGVYVFEMDNDHRPIDYYQVLQGTVDNCAGGTTPWGTWVSCEEESGYGHCWQTDPANKDQTGPTKSEMTALTGYPGNWEAFAWDEYSNPPRGYVSDDAEPEEAPLAYGAINRFTPDAAALKCWQGKTKEARWCTLNSGSIDYLKLHPYEGGSNCGTISWVTDPAESSSGMYRGAEGMDITDGILRFIAKEDHLVFKVDLRKDTYCQFSTFEGFPHQPDNIRWLGDTLYMCTDDRTPNGVIGMNDHGYFSIFYEMTYDSEAAGVSFSPDGLVMYVAFQESAVWTFWREDGLPFDGPTAGIHYTANTGHVYDNGDSVEFIVAGIAEEVVEEALEEL